MVTYSETIHVLEVSHRVFKTPMIKMLKDMVEKMDNIHEEVGNFSRL